MSAIAKEILTKSVNAIPLISQSARPKSLYRALKVMDGNGVGETVVRLILRFRKSDQENASRTWSRCLASTTVALGSRSEQRKEMDRKLFMEAKMLRINTLYHSRHKGEKQAQPPQEASPRIRLKSRAV